MTKFQTFAAIFVILALIAVVTFQNAVIEQQSRLIQEFSQDPRCMGATSSR